MSTPEDLRDKTDEQKGIKIRTTFCCIYCNAGAERYSEVFINGTCRQCGAPLKTFEATISEQGEERVKRSIFLVAHPETEVDVRKVVEEMEAQGIHVIEANDIIQGLAPGQITQNLSYLIRATLGTLFVPSPNLDKTPAIFACLDELSVSRDTGILWAPLFLTPDSFNHLPSLMRGRIGVKWYDTSSAGHTSSKEKFFKQIKEQIAQLPSI
jgi:hypothetical protein